MLNKKNTSHIAIDLTLPMVLQAIETVLNEYPDYPYHSAFSSDDLRQKLVSYVLSHIPNRYNVRGGKEASRPLVHHFIPLNNSLEIDMIIRAGILHILCENIELCENINWL